jgi:hypothetical protein
MGNITMRLTSPRRSALARDSVRKIANAGKPDCYGCRHRTL